MKLRAYSSLSAFLAYYRALSAGTAGGAQRPLTADEQHSLGQMDALLGDALTDDERVVLRLSRPAAPVAEAAGAVTNGAAARRRARAETKLRHVLDARGLLTA